MNLPKHLALGGTMALLMCSCYYDDYSSNGYGDPYQQQQGGTYGNTQQGGYGNGTYGQPQQQAPQGGYGANQPTYGSESGDVVTYPGDGGAPSYGGGNTGGGYGTTAPSPSPSGSGRNYSVQKGDNLYRIGKKYGVSMQEIIRANGLSNTTIHPGQELIIP